MLSMGLVLTVSNGLHFLIAWELFAVCAYFLITLDRQRREVRAAGWLYLAASHAGTLCLFAFFALLAARTGSWDLGPDARTRGAGSAVLAGAGRIRSEGGRLPAAHLAALGARQCAESRLRDHVGRRHQDGHLRHRALQRLAAGAVGGGLGGDRARRDERVARASPLRSRKTTSSACSRIASVENIGVILIGVGGALLAVTHGDAPWGRLALAGALLHVWNHGAFKALLFFGAGSVLHATGTREMSRLGGLWRAMPWTAGLFALGSRRRVGSAAAQWVCQ